MRTIDLEELATDVRRYLTDSGQGETLQIMQGSQKIATIVIDRSLPAVSGGQRLLEVAARNGWQLPRTGRKTDITRFRRAVTGGTSASDMIIEDRR